MIDKHGGCRVKYTFGSALRSISNTVRIVDVDEVWLGGRVDDTELYPESD